MGFWPGNGMASRDAAGDCPQTRPKTTRPIEARSGVSPLEGQRDLREPVRVVEIAAVQLREPRRRRAGPGSQSSAGSATRGRPRQAASVPRRGRARRRGRRSQSTRAPRSARPAIAVSMLSSAGPDGRDRDHGPPGRDRRDGAVHQVGGGVRLEEETRELTDLQRDLERGAVVDAARDDRAALDGGAARRAQPHPRTTGRAGRRSGPASARAPTDASASRVDDGEEERDRTERVQVRLRRRDRQLVPASSGSTASAARPIGESGLFVIAIVGRPWRRASSITALTSGDSPDCEMPITSAPSRRGGCS